MEEVKEQAPHSKKQYCTRSGRATGQKPRLIVVMELAVTVGYDPRLDVCDRINNGLVTGDASLQALDLDPESSIVIIFQRTLSSIKLVELEIFRILLRITSRLFRSCP